MPAPLIIGGGPAGAAAAIHLARAGTRALLLERTEGPIDKVCGDFLSVEAVSELARLGVDVGQLGASTISRLRMFHGRRVAEAELPFAARGLSRRVLDEALLTIATEHGVCVRRGTLVHALAQRGGDLLWRSDSREQTAGTVFLATGKHELRGVPRAASDAGAIGLKTYLRLAPDQAASLAGHVELILFRGGYAGLQQVEDSTAVLCTMVEKARFAAYGGTWTTLLDRIAGECPHLRRRLLGSVPLRTRPVAIAGVPYGFVHRPVRQTSHSSSDHGLFRLGDQTSVIPSLTGDGIALALASARAATTAWQAGESAADYHTRFASVIAGQMRLATLLHRLLLGPGAAWATALGGMAPALLRQAAVRTRFQSARAERCIV